MFGGFMAMYEDGYGICYSIRKHNVKFSITANNSCSSTSASKMHDAIHEALIDMQTLCLTRNVLYGAGGGKKGSGGAASGAGSAAKL
jgi:hypothetical protein